MHALAGPRPQWGVSVNTQFLQGLVISLASKELLNNPPTKITKCDSRGVRNIPISMITVHKFQALGKVSLLLKRTGRLGVPQVEKPIL